VAGRADERPGDQSVEDRIREIYFLVSDSAALSGIRIDQNPFFGFLMKIALMVIT
jgi:hypothetical protein